MSASTAQPRRVPAAKKMSLGAALSRAYSEYREARDATPAKDLNHEAKILWCYKTEKIIARVRKVKKQCLDARNAGNVVPENKDHSKEFDNTVDEVMKNIEEFKASDSDDDIEISDNISAQEVAKAVDEVVVETLKESEQKMPQKQTGKGSGKGIQGQPSGSKRRNRASPAPTDGGSSKRSRPSPVDEDAERSDGAAEIPIPGASFRSTIPTSHSQSPFVPPAQQIIITDTDVTMEGPFSSQDLPQGQPEVPKSSQSTDADQGAEDEEETITAKKVAEMSAIVRAMHIKHDQKVGVTAETIANAIRDVSAHLKLASTGLDAIYKVLVPGGPFVSRTSSSLSELEAIVKSLLEPEAEDDDRDKDAD